jgi:hypothetical protein
VPNLTAEPPESQGIYFPHCFHINLGFIIGVLSRGAKREEPFGSPPSLLVDFLEMGNQLEGNEAVTVTPRSHSIVTPYHFNVAVIHIDHLDEATRDEILTIDL